jgi:hypothetical protein
MKRNSYRFHLGLWYCKNDTVYEGEVPGHPGMQTRQTFRHVLYVAHSDSTYNLIEQAVQMRCLNDATWDLYNFVVYDMHKQVSYPLIVKLDASDLHSWHISVTMNGLEMRFEQRRYVVEHDTEMVAVEGPRGRYELKEKK